MNAMESMVLRIAKTYNKRDDLINEFEKQSTHVSTSKKGDYFWSYGIILFDYSYYNHAIYIWEYTIKYYSDINDKVGEIDCYNGLGESYRKLGNFNLAIEYQNKALQMAEQINDKSKISACYINLGVAYHALGNNEKSINCHINALKIKKEMGDDSWISHCYTNIGAVYATSGAFDKAIEYNLKALSFGRDIIGNIWELRSFINLGLAYHGIGEYRKSIDYYEKALRITNEIGDLSEISSCYTNLGSTYYNIGNIESARKYYNESLKIDKKINDKSGEGKCYGNLGNTYFALGDYDNAMKNYNIAFNIANEVDDKQWKSICLMNIGNVYQKINDFEAAINSYMKVLDLCLSEELRDKYTESICYLNLGTAYMKIDENKNAIQNYEKAIESSRKIGDIDTLMRAHFGVAEFYSDTDQRTAYSHLKKTIKILEEIGDNLIEEPHQIMHYGLMSKPYELMVPICLKLGNIREAFEFVERAKSRAFNKSLSTSEIKIQPESKEIEKLLKEERKYLNLIRSKRMKYLNQYEENFEIDDIDIILDKLIDIHNRIEKVDSEYADLRIGKPFYLDTLLNILYSESKELAFIEYYLTDDNIFIFIIKSNKQIYVETIETSKSKLESYIKNYIKEIENFNGSEILSASFLNENLIDPIAKYLNDVEIIYFIPFGFIHYLPLHSFQINSEPLINKYKISYLPNSFIFNYCKYKGSDNDNFNNAIVFGVDFEDEAIEISEILNSEIIKGNDVTKDTVIKNINKDIVHFSCHGTFKSESPLLSEINLFSDDKLTVKDIFNLNLQTDIVTLSACKTGINDRTPGDELVGFTRAFIYAGASSVIVSLWSVESKSAKELMIEFYKCLKKGNDKVTALQKAQLKIMMKPEFSHPYYWSPFILIGDWDF